MTNEEMKIQIETSANAAGKSRQYVTIENNPLDCILVYRGPDDEYFFQGEEATNLQTEAEQASEKFNVSPEDYILWSAQGW